MKNRFFVMIVLVLLFIPLTQCLAKSHCPRHPNADESCECGAVKRKPVNERYHDYYERGDYWCVICGHYATEWFNMWREEHTFVNGVCIECGYERSGLPTGEELQAQALRQGKNVLNQTLTIVHPGNIRSGAGAAYTQVGAAVAGQTFTVRDYTVIDGKYVWFKVNYGAGSAWISATLGEVDAYQDFGIDPSVYIGRTCKVTAASARCRTGAGKDFPVVTNVKAGATFAVIDAKIAKNGRPWLKIRVKNLECWISSGMVEVY